MNAVIEALLNRSSEPRLTSPGPTRSHLEQAFNCASRAPDHALLRPWRYIVVEGDARGELAEALVNAAADDATGEPVNLDKLRQAPLRAPTVIVGIAVIKPHPKVPKIEQIMSAASGMAYLVLALQSLGYGAMWRSGSIAHSANLRAQLGLGDNERITGFLYTGTVVDPKPSVPRPEVDSFVSYWQG